MKRWSIRNTGSNAVQKIREVSIATGIGFGELVTQAILFWYDELPDEWDEDEDFDDDELDEDEFERAA